MLLRFRVLPLVFVISLLSGCGLALRDPLIISPKRNHV